MSFDIRRRDHSAVRCSRTAGKWRKIKVFKLLRLASSRALPADNVSRERDALAAFHLAAKVAVGARGAAGTLLRRIAHFAFPDGIADADDHWRLPLLRIIR
jgi:hypothetical protein